MTKVTTLHLNSAEFSSHEWSQHFHPPSITIEASQSANITHSDPVKIPLNWVHHQEVVSMPHYTLYVQAGKRVVDLILAGLVTVFILSWLIPLIGALIICESPGPVLFIQPRSGRKGMPFRCLKFRTMRYEPRTGSFQQTARGDTRITRLGRFLRKTNLDEMPQFLNVLMGHMSLVGPRPHALPHDAQHWKSAAYRERYWVRPGITGLAQIKGARGAINQNQRMDHRVRFDHFYIPRQAFLFDMKICLWTIGLMFKGDKNAW